MNQRSEKRTDNDLLPVANSLPSNLSVNPHLDAPQAASSSPSSPCLTPMDDSAENPTLAEDKSYQPPDYYDISIVPDNCFLYPDSCPPIGAVSTAKAESSLDGVVSADPTLDHNPDELWRYLMSYLKPPVLKIQIIGTHKELRCDSRHYGYKGGHYGHNGCYGQDYDSSPHVNASTVTVTDFSMDIVLSHFVANWCRIVSLPSTDSKQAGATSTVRETLEEYTKSTNQFKEFHLSKQIVWDFGRLHLGLINLIRANGYPHRIQINFVSGDRLVSAIASNAYSKAAHSCIVRSLCVLTCFCIVAWPLWAAARKRIANRLVVEYPMIMTIEEFYDRNALQISLAVARRSKRAVLLAV